MSPQVAKKRGSTALHLSALHDNRDAIETLVKHGADINLRNGVVAKTIPISPHFNFQLADGYAGPGVLPGRPRESSVHQVGGGGVSVRQNAQVRWKTWLTLSM